jgi:hypothetical protein
VTPRRTKISMAQMAVASDGGVLVNVAQLTTSDSLAAILKLADRTGLDVFVGVVVPGRLRGRVLRDVDDALADVVGRWGPKITSPVGEASASDHAVARGHRGRRGRREERLRPRRGRRA